MAEIKNQSIKPACPSCKCNVFLALIGMWADVSFQGSRLRVLWPDRATEQNNNEFANVACPQCGAILVIHANGNVVDTGNKLFGKIDKVRKSRGRRKAVSKV